MAKRKPRKSAPTSVHLYPEAQAIKDKLSPIYGLRNIMSAGLILFDDMADSEQKAMLEKLTESDSFENHLRSFLDWLDTLKSEGRDSVLVAVLSRATDRQIRDYLEKSVEQVGPVPAEIRHGQRAKTAKSQ